MKKIEDTRKNIEEAKKQAYAEVFKELDEVYEGIDEVNFCHKFDERGFDELKKKFMV